MSPGPLRPSPDFWEREDTLGECWGTAGEGRGAVAHSWGKELALPTTNRWPDLGMAQTPGTGRERAGNTSHDACDKTPAQHTLGDTRRRCRSRPREARPRALGAAHSAEGAVAQRGRGHPPTPLPGGASTETKGAGRGYTGACTRAQAAGTARPAGMSPTHSKGMRTQRGYTHCRRSTRGQRGDTPTGAKAARPPQCASAPTPAVPAGT
jgi:hypothetical protein